MIKKKFAVIIYARINSKRLPGKTLLKVNKETILGYILKRIIKTKKFKHVIVATSNLKSDKKIVRFCKKNKIIYFCGSNNDVAKRTIDCCKKFKISDFMRVCSDRLYFDTNLAVNMKKFYIKNNYEICTNALKKTFPTGQTCEIINYTTFKKSYKFFDRVDKEHIFNYFYRNTKQFRIKNFKSNISLKYQNLNLSIDREIDYKRAIKCFKDLKIGFRFQNKKVFDYYLRNFYL